MSTVTVYRVENDHGEGAFGCGAASRAQRAAREEGSVDPYDHPCPLMDSGLSETWAELEYDRRSSFYFGFASVEDYLRWFSTPAQRQALTDGGCKLSVYEIDESAVLYGERQAVFLLTQALQVDRLDCTFCD